MNIVPWSEMSQMAEAIAKSGLFGMKDANSVLALMAVAQAEGLHPATAARDFHIIQGRPALKADAMLARFQQAGGTVNWEEYTDAKVTGRFIHPNGGSLAVTWTIEQATRIGLVKPGSGWQKFPRAMLRSRCISEGIRSVYPGSVTGFYSPEEVADFEPVKPRISAPKAVEGVELVEDEQSLLQAFVDDSEAIVGQYKLMVPNLDKPYASYDTKEQWIEGYGELISKIRNSKKLDEDEKKGKCGHLVAANAEFLSGLDVMQKIKVRAMAAPPVETDSPKTESL